MEEHKQTFSTAIKLLHSKHKDSGDNLLRLVDDLIQKRYGADRSVMKVLKEKPHLLGHGQGFQGAKEEEDKKPPPAGSSEPPPVVYLDNGTSSSFPGVISIPDEPSSSLLELERDFEASVSGLDAAALPLPEVKPVVTEANTEASTAKPLKPGRGRKKRLPTPAKRERSSSANILDEVLTLMDKTNGKVVVKPPPTTTTTTEGVPAARAPSCSLCSDGAMAKAVTCRRCQQTFLLCCVEMSAPGFDPGAWLCGYCLLRCRQSTDPQLWSCPLPSTASFRKVTTEEDVTVDQKAGEELLRDRPGCGKRQKQSSSPEKLRRGTRLRK